MAMASLSSMLSTLKVGENALLVSSARISLSASPSPKTVFLGNSLKSSPSTPKLSPFKPLNLRVSALAAEALVEGGVEGEVGGSPSLYPHFAAFKIHGTGRRKTAVARVGLIEGTGQILVNDLPLTEYFQNQALMVQAVRLPLSSLGYETKYDLVIKAHGGGLSAQAQAMVLGIARALCVANATNRPPLKAQGMLTRDSRAVERKKYGLKKARKAPQFSKR